MVRVGEKVEDFELEAYQSNRFKKIKLSDYSGKWVILYFYPADFTFVCPTELSEAQDYYREFQKNNAEILSVSTDTAFVHKAWHDNSPAISKIEYPMLADPTGKVCRYFGTLIENEGLSLRGTFIISPDRILKSIEINDNSIGRSSKEILRRLQASIFVAEHNGEVCPASWKPGDKTLKAGINLVGKI